MATITTRIGKGDPLTFTEMDSNLTNLNNDKLENINNESIGDLSDVDITSNTPTNGQALLWDSATSKFVVGDAGADLATSSIGDLQDVDRTGVTDGDILMWDSTNSRFIPSTSYTSGGSTIIGSVSSIDDVRQPNTITLSNPTGISSGDEITFSGTDVTSAGLSTSTTYYIFADVGNGAFEISANNSTALSITDFGTPTDFNYSVTTQGTSGFTLSMLADTNINAPTQGDVLKYDSASSEWNTGQVDISTAILNDLSDVSVPGPSANQLLAYDGTGWGATDSLSGKTLTNYEETVYSLGTVSGTEGTNFTIDPSNGNIQTMTVNGNITINGPTSMNQGSSVTLIITQDATGGRTLSSTMKFAGATATLSTDANAVDIVTIFYDGTNHYASLSTGFAQPV